MKYTPHKNFNISRYTYVWKRARLYHIRLNNRHAYDSVGWRGVFQFRLADKFMLPVRIKEKKAIFEKT